MSSPSTVPTKIRFDAFELDSTSGELRKSGILLKLQPQPFRVLLLLIERAGQVVTREELQRHVWTDSTFVDFDHGINFSINHIRRVLSDNAENPRYVETLPKRGYRFIGVVEQPLLAKQSVAAKTDTDAHYPSAKEVLVYPRRLEDEILPSSPPMARKNSPRWTLALSAGAAGMVLACLALGIYFWKSRRGALNLEGMRITRLTESGNAETVAISPNGQYVAYVLQDGEQRSLNMRQVATGSDVQILAPAVVELRGLTFSPDGNYIFFLRTPKENFSVDYLYQMPVLGGTPRQLIRDIDTPISFSPDGKQFAFVRILPTPEMDLVIANVDGSGERILVKRPRSTTFYYPAWSPDGRTIALAGADLPGDGHLFAVSPEDGSVQAIYTTQSAIGRTQWLPDGSGLLAVIHSQGRGQLWYVSYPSGKARRVTNDLTDYALETLDLTGDGKSLVTVEYTIASNLWVVDGGEVSHARKITSGKTAARNISAGPERTIVFVNQKDDVYSIREDGSAMTLLAPKMHGNRNPSVCRDGRHIVFESASDGQRNIWRMDADGSHPTQLTLSGSAVSPVCSPDSQSVQYFDAMRNWRVPIGGGMPVQLDLKNLAAVPSDYSPDGKLMAYHDFGPEGDVPNHIAVIPATGGEPIYKFPLRGDANFERFRWTPDGAGLDYFLTNNGVGNIWRQPVPKGPARQVTNFTSDRIFSFDWSSDGKQLYVARGSISSDIVLITNFR